MSADDAVLRLLCRHCPRKLPFTGRLYRGHNLKNLLDTRKKRLMTSLSQPRNRRLTHWLNALPYLKPWIAASRMRQRREQKRWCDTYSAKAFTASHDEHKDNVLARFKTLLRRHADRGCNIVLLDDFNRGGKCLRCVSGLATCCSPRRLFLANRGKNTVCRAASAAGATAFSGDLKVALRSPEAFGKTVFGAAYLDTCSGSPPVICDLVDTLCARASKNFVLAITIVGRCSRPGHGSQINRVATIEGHIAKLGFKPDGASLHKYALVYGQACTLFYTR